MSGNERREYPAGVAGRFFGTLLLYDQHPAPPAGSLLREAHLEVRLNVITASFYLSSLIVPSLSLAPMSDRNCQPGADDTYKHARASTGGVARSAGGGRRRRRPRRRLRHHRSRHRSRRCSPRSSLLVPRRFFPHSLSLPSPPSLCLSLSFSHPCPFFLTLLPFALSSCRPSPSVATRPARRTRTLDVHTYRPR